MTAKTYVSLADDEGFLGAYILPGDLDCTEALSMCLNLGFKLGRSGSVQVLALPVPPGEASDWPVGKLLDESFMRQTGAMKISEIVAAMERIGDGINDA